MIHSVPPPPSPTQVQSTERRHPVVVAVLAATTGLVGGVLAGLVIGRLVIASYECSPGDGWCGLGAAISGMFLGGVAGIATYVTAGIVAIFHLRPAGDRGLPVAVHLAVPAGLAVLATALGALG